ncbi:DUF7837 family putative zinc-binding protein [Haloarcula sebkhae]|uniref:Uncharacterized protein n=1 Tax=Haloarcula sebkhae TaxID=932660 RepID=A0ACC6VLE9_9EURY|nr:hypothetical protein [Haloarcula sebkhae]
MSDDTRSPDRCPDCDQPIANSWILVEYEEDDGTEDIWAECPTCRDVVELE